MVSYMNLTQTVLLSHTIIHNDSWPLYPEDEAYVFTQTGQATEGGAGDVLPSSGLLLAIIGKKQLASYIVWIVRLTLQVYC